MCISSSDKPVEEKGIVGKLGLDDWKVALPLGILAGVPLLHNEVRNCKIQYFRSRQYYLSWLIQIFAQNLIFFPPWYISVTSPQIIVLSAETQLLGVFILFCSTTYTQLGPSVAKSLDDYSNDVRQKLAKVDEAILSDVHETISATKDLLTLEEDVKSIHAVVDDLSVAQADVLNYAEEHKYRDAIARKLDSLVAIEEAATVAIRTRTVATVKADVIKAFTDDKKTKEAALDQAVAILLAGANAPIGKDIVGDVFKSSLKSFGSAYSKLSPEKDEILVQLQKDIDAVISPPQIDTTGSNVYISHPVKS